MVATEQSAVQTEADAFTTEVIRGAVVSITDEMKLTLQRTAYSNIIYEMEDFTVGLYDVEGNTISFGLGLPMWMSGLGSTIKMKIDHWGRDRMDPGDVLLTSEAAVHGSHVNHMIFTIPVFHDGEVVAFSSSMAHWPDVGGMLGGPTRDIYSEGFQMPFVKAYRRGEINEEIFSIIRTNCRFPEIAMGDCRAQLATIRTGERRLLALLDKYGNNVFRAAIQHIYDQSERIARQAVREIPDGIYEAEQFLDSDGINLDNQIPVRVKVIVAGDEMTIDLSDMPPPVEGSVNCGMTAGLSGAQVGFKTLTTPTLLPINDGALRPLKIILPEDTIISARSPAPMRAWMAVPDTTVDTIWKALTPVMPERGPAGHHGLLGGSGFYASIDAHGRTVPNRGEGAGGLTGGGWGAVNRADGQCATICINDGDTHSLPVEAGEAKSEDVIVEKALWNDSGGPGKFRGGLGVIQRVEATVSSLGMVMAMERRKCPPWGALGGMDGKPQCSTARRAGEAREEVLPGSWMPVRFEPGDQFTAYMAGGGGFGDPLERDPERVLSDVRNGYVSLESAEKDYGVVIHHPQQREYVLDQAASERLRTDMRQALR